MKTCSLFLLTVMVVTAALAAPLSPHNSQDHLLKEIIHDVHNLDLILKDKAKTIFVPEVISKYTCTPQNLFQAGKILQAYEAKRLGLHEKDWLLPRRLVTYTGDTQPEDVAQKDEVPLHQLLMNIKICAQKINNGKKHFPKKH
ncbi:hypothetical protein NFI96_033735 [Prochilodus magdalenae]|nr:hypothetical protein NFI96_033735 [Prochilodus magdalenae]